MLAKRYHNIAVQTHANAHSSSSDVLCAIHDWRFKWMARKFGRGCRSRVDKSLQKFFSLWQSADGRALLFLFYSDEPTNKSPKLIQRQRVLSRSDDRPGVKKDDLFEAEKKILKNFFTQLQCMSKRWNQDFCTPFEDQNRRDALWSSRYCQKKHRKRPSGSTGRPHSWSASWSVFDQFSSWRNRRIQEVGLFQYLVSRNTREVPQDDYLYGWIL